MGSDLPPEAKALLAQRQQAIEKIDNKLSQELEKIKVDYTKRGNLEAAVAVSELIKGFPGPEGPALEGSWKRNTDGGVFTFDGRGGGVFQCNKYKAPFHIVYDSSRKEFLLIGPSWIDTLSNGANDKTMSGHGVNSHMYTITRID